ncbi:MAG: tetratricopeptide repeat-containing sensor histidine kinase [Cyclobacteriaceae bacterium]|nr:tetratricopeptide repeat-containing sensor histidine kinase [Cyclobacteriaceae bacterium]MCH8516943.1 tetratricopeptide repeat-containing sensor histidine kinase [Cyclobacteriaceae bacterium]
MQRLITIAAFLLVITMSSSFSTPLEDSLKKLPPDQALRLADELIRSGESKTNKSEILRFMAFINLKYLKDYEKALEYSLESLIEDERKNNRNGILQNRRNLAEIYLEVNDFLQHRDQWRKILEHANDQNDFELRAEAYFVLAQSEVRLENQGNALDFYYEALRIYEELSKKGKEALVHAHISYLWIRMNEEEQAQKYMELAVRNLQHGENSYDRAMTIFKKAQFHQYRRQYDAAKRDFERAKTLFEAGRNVEDLTKCYLQLGRVYFELNDNKKALNEWQQGLKIAGKSGNRRDLRQFYDQLFGYYVKQNDAAKALAYKNLFVQINELINSEESINELIQLENKFEIKKKENEIGLLLKDKEINELQLQRQQTRLIFTFSLSGLLLVFLVIGGYYYRDKVKSKKELENLNTKLQELNDTKDKFFSIIGHDLKGPLNSLSSFTHLLSNHSEHLSKEEIKKLSADIDHSLKNLKNLLNNLLEWARSQTGGLVMSPEKLDILPRISGVKETLAGQAAEKQINLEIHGKPDIYAHADPNAFDTVIRNLVSNAIKYTPESNKIAIHFWKKGDYIQVSVKDSGIGMPEKVQESLFKIDKVQSREGTSKEKGTGLGLILCKELVELNDGRIYFESKEGEGSTFFTEWKSA